MSISTGPVSTPPPKKRGLGCLGCGCVVLGLIALLLLVIFGSIGFVCYKTILDITSTTPPAIPTFNATDDAYASVRRKLADFDHDVMNHQAATVRLSADEINTMLSRDPNLDQNHIHAFVSFTETEGRLQASFPTDLPSHGWLKGRYCSIDTSFGVQFNPGTKSVEFAPHTLQIGDKSFLEPTSDNNQQAQEMLDLVVPALNQSFNTTTRKSPDGAALLDQAKTIGIQAGQLVIETQ